MAYNPLMVVTVKAPEGLTQSGSRVSPLATEAAQWIAINDNEGSGDEAEEIAGYISTCLVADVFRLNRDVLGRWIRAMRDKAGLP